MCIYIIYIVYIYIYTYVYMCRFIRPWWLMLKQGDRRNGLKGEQEHPAIQLYTFCPAVLT